MSGEDDFNLRKFEFDNLEFPAYNDLKMAFFSYKVVPHPNSPAHICSKNIPMYNSDKKKLTIITLNAQLRIPTMS